MERERNVDIPENELWLHLPDVKASLDRALEWSASHPRAETELKAVAAMLESPDLDA